MAVNRGMKEIVLLALIIGSILGGDLLAGSPVAGQQDAAAGLVPEQGLVQVQGVNDAAAGWQKVDGWHEMYVGDSVRTDALGLAMLTFFTGMQVEVLPSSQLAIASLEGATGVEPAKVSLAMVLGDALHAINEQVAGNVRYEVRTPGAFIAVRGTEFWTSVDTEGETWVAALAGEVAVTDVNEEAEPVMLGAGEAITVTVDGMIGPVTSIGTTPAIPPNARLAPAECGDGECSVTEAAEGICPLDCAELPACGNRQCDVAAGEDGVTCPDDCLPEAREWRVHFFWGEGRCDFFPPVVAQRGPAVAHWGVGCFDSAAHASAHPHPADYRLYVDGQAWDMSTLSQSGPAEHNPYCPWGWDFMMGPVTLPPGMHRLRLVETITDTWTAVTSGVGGRNAGESVELNCMVLIVP